MTQVKLDSGLICIYHSNGPFEAHQLAHWMERNNIIVRILGDLEGITGGIPVQDAWPTLWVHPSDTERAQKAIQSYQAPTTVHPEWSCPSCSELNGPAFGSCWSCETTAPN